MNRFRILFGDTKTIWLYTGYVLEDIVDEMTTTTAADLLSDKVFRFEIFELCDVLVDGRFEADKKDLSLAFRGSANQRLIDVKKSLSNGEIVLWMK